MVFPSTRRVALFRNKSLQLGMVGLFVGIGVSCLDTIWSVYLDSFFHDMAVVGLISGLLSLVGVLTFLFSTPIVERHPQSRLWIIGIYATVLSYLLFYFVHDPIIFLLVAVFLVIMTVIRVEAFGIIVRDVNKLSGIGSAEGLVYALINVGWLLGPLIAGFVATTFGYSIIFLFSALFVALGASMFLLIKLKRVEHHTTDDGTLSGSLRNLQAFLKRPELLKAYVLSGGISLYWGIVFTFIPLMIIRSGLEGYWVGLFLFGVGIPLAMLEYWIGSVADKRGFRRFFILGYIILAAAGLCAYFFSDIYAIMIVFVLASCGAACLEGTRESYFFTITKKSEEEKFYGPYLTHIDVFSTIGKLAGALVLVFFAANYLFLLLAAEMLFFLYIATTVKNSVKAA